MTDSDRSSQCIMSARPRSAMDSASDFGSDGCGFESRRGRLVYRVSLACLFQISPKIIISCAIRVQPDLLFGKIPSQWRHDLVHYSRLFSLHTGYEMRIFLNQDRQRKPEYSSHDHRWNPVTQHDRGCRMPAIV
jgi:hypothetical protein